MADTKNHASVNDSDLTEWQDRCYDALVQLDLTTLSKRYMVPLTTLLEAAVAEELSRGSVLRSTEITPRLRVIRG